MVAIGGQNVTHFLAGGRGCDSLQQAQVRTRGMLQVDLREKGRIVDQGEDCLRADLDVAVTDLERRGGNQYFDFQGCQRYGS
jgi:hypothetical protein